MDTLGLIVAFAVAAIAFARGRQDKKTLKKKNETTILSVDTLLLET